MSIFNKDPNSNEKWNNLLKWKHEQKLNKVKEKNRYYHRGSSPSGIDIPSCCENSLLSYSPTYGNFVVSSNNPYAEDNPEFSQYLTFSIFPNKVLNIEQSEDVIKIFNNSVVKDSEMKYGPFDQFNFNIVALTAFNEKFWNQGWKNNQIREILDQYPLKNNSLTIGKYPQLLQIAYYSATIFKKKMNEIFNKIFSNNQFKSQKIYLARLKISSILRSPQTEYLKYTIIISLVKNFNSREYIFKFISYFDPDKKKIILGKAFYLGHNLSEKIMLPQGKDPSFFNDSGRALHPLVSKESKLMPESEATKMYLDYMKNTRRYQKVYNLYQPDNWRDGKPIVPWYLSLPFWFRSRLRYNCKKQLKTGYGSFNSLFDHN